MKVYLFFIILFVTKIGFTQVIPIGTVSKGKRLPTVSTYYSAEETRHVVSLYGSLRLNDSKLPILETGFVLLPNSDPRLPTLSNARVYIVSGGVQDFSMTDNNFTNATEYKYRSYAKNSNNEVAYSETTVFLTGIDYCDPSPCMNAGICISTISGPICLCTTSFCGNCCATLADYSCPGGQDYPCNVVNPNEIAVSIQSKRANYFNTIIRPKANNSVWSLNNYPILQGQAMQGLK